jgi:hypothetical protein
VVVRVDQAGHHQQAAGVQHLVGLLQGGRQLGVRAHPFNAVVADVDRGISQLLARIVQGGQGVGLADQQGAHGVTSLRREK